MSELSIDFDNRGLMTAAPGDVVPDGYYPNFLNMTSQKDGYIENRQGTSLVSPINLGSAVHSQGRIRANFVAITTACPTAQPVLDVFYSYTLTAVGGNLPYTWSIVGGALPTGMVIDDGAIFGTPVGSGTFLFTVQAEDSSHPPQVAQISCQFVIDPAPPSNIAADVIYAESSPYEGVTASRNLWLLDGENQVMYRSTVTPPVTGAFAAWEEVAIPAGSWKRLAGNANSNVGLTGCFGTDARIMTKTLVNSDPTDFPWIAYDIPDIMHGGVPIIGGMDLADFWLPVIITEISATIAAINTSNVICAGLSTGSDVTFDQWGSYTNTPPAGTWNQLWGQISNSQGDYRAALAIGVGTTFLRFFNAGAGEMDPDYGDVAWTEWPCPDGDWRSVTAGLSSDYPFVVGVGPDAACANTTYPLEALTAFSMPAGWIGVDPRVIYDPDMYNVDPGGGDDGTYIIVGGTIDGASVIVCVPITDGGETLLSPIVSTLPTVPAGIVWTAIAKNEAYAGVIVVGTAGSTVYILSNPETTESGTPATYDDWHLRTLAETPFP